MRLCDCGQPVFGTDKKTRIGYCKNHQYKRTDLDKRTPAQKAMEKAKTATKAVVASHPLQEGGAEMNRWFKERRKEMTGKCRHCGGKSCRDDDRYYKFSIAHILPKNFFKSVATHESNFIELCFWNQSCHTNYDNYTLDLTDLNCFNEVIEKFQRMWPAIDKKERRRIPQALLQYVEVDE